MAFLIPENLRSRRDVSPGVARFAAALRDGLDDDVTVWYEPMFEVGGERPDLVVMVPFAGILVIEVLESRASAIRGARDGRLLVADGSAVREIDGPLNRAAAFERHLTEAIQADHRLLPTERLPVRAAAVFPYLSRQSAQSHRLGDALPLDRCLFRDDLEEGISGGAAFRRGIVQLIGSVEGEPISAGAEKIHRALIHPDTVIATLQLPFPTTATGRADDELMVLDRKQESLAKTLGVGHRVIRGVAGSGKTLVLTYRARLLAESLPSQRVLITCFTRSLAGRLRHQLEAWPSITVKTLDSLMAQARRSAGCDPDDYDDFTRESLAERALQALDACPDGVSHFHHVLIDEAQDFPTPALQFAVRLLVDGSDSLLAVADPVQNIYRTHFTWKAAGINAVGRTRWLDQSYRNTREILEYAHTFVMAGGGFDVTSDPDPEDETMITAPTFSPRSGPFPLVLWGPSRQGEVVNIADLCRRLLDRGVVPGDVAILYAVTWTAGFNWPESIRTQFAQEGIPLFWANDPSQSANRDHVGEDRARIQLCTIWAAKGLEFRHVVVCGWLDVRPPAESRVTRSLVYVGMTRATHELTLSASGEHPFLADVERS